MNILNRAFSGVCSSLLLCIDAMLSRNDALTLDIQLFLWQLRLHCHQRVCRRLLAANLPSLY